MGSCCVNENKYKGEDFVKLLLIAPNLKLRKINYTDLLNKIFDTRVEQLIPKKHIIQYVIPEFYEQNGNDINNKFTQSIFDTIINKLEDNNNMYIVLLYFYPFINHTGEKSYQNFFKCVKFIVKTNKNEIPKEEIQKVLKKYITFCTRDITSAIYSKCNDSDKIKGSMFNLLNQVFTENNINIFLAKLMSLLTDNDKNQNIKVEDFQKLFQEYDIASIEKVRSYLLRGDDYLN